MPRPRGGGTPSGRGRGRPPNAPRDGRERPPALAECFARRCTEVLNKLAKKDHYNIFLEPVNTDEIEGYADIVEKPMDFTTMRSKISNGVYKSLGEFRRDLDLIWANCLLFNGKEPNNVFSKKAIELRKMTEKLIVATRAALESDKSILIRWKERHRRKRPFDQSSAAGAASNSSSVPNSSAPSPPDLLDDGTSSPADTQTGAHRARQSEPSAHDANLVKSREDARAQALRAQYAGGSGLNKRSSPDSQAQQFTTADGSIVRAPIGRYNPMGRHWEDRHATRPIVLKQRLDFPDAAYRALGSRPRLNSCRPMSNVTSVKVKDYVQSLQAYVSSVGTVATRIINELLSPELALLHQEEEQKKRKREMKAGANSGIDGTAAPESKVPARAPTPEAPKPVFSSTPNHVAPPALPEVPFDPSTANMAVCVLPKLNRRIHELDGENGLEHIISKELVDEIRQVPVDVVDFAMPYGVSVATMAEVARLITAPNVHLDPNDVASLESLRQNTATFASTLTPQIVSGLSGASLMTPIQLHDIQLRARSNGKSNLEAERQRLVAEEQQRHTAARNSEALAAQRKRENGVAVQSMQKTSRQNLGRNAADTSALGASRTPNRGRHHPFDSNAAIQAQSRAALELVQGTTNAVLTAQRQLSSGNGAGTGAAVASPSPGAVGGGGSGGSHAVGNGASSAEHSLPPATKDSTCDNCGTSSTPGWRAGPAGPKSGERLCNACGLFWQKHKSHRPENMWGRAVARRGRNMVEGVGKASPRMVAGSPAQRPRFGATRRGAASQSQPRGIPTASHLQQHLSAPQRAAAVAQLQHGLPNGGSSVRAGAKHASAALKSDVGLLHQQRAAAPPIHTLQQRPQQRRLHPSPIENVRATETRLAQAGAPPLLAAGTGVPLPANLQQQQQQFQLQQQLLHRQHQQQLLQQQPNGQLQTNQSQEAFMMTVQRQQANASMAGVARPNQDPFMARDSQGQMTGGGTGQGLTARAHPQQMTLSALGQVNAASSGLPQLVMSAGGGTTGSDFQEHQQHQLLQHQQSQQAQQQMGMSSGLPTDMMALRGMPSFLDPSLTDAPMSSGLGANHTGMGLGQAGSAEGEIVDNLFFGQSGLDGAGNNAPSDFGF